MRDWRPKHEFTVMVSPKTNTDEQQWYPVAFGSRAAADAYMDHIAEKRPDIQEAHLFELHPLHRRGWYARAN